MISALASKMDFTVNILIYFTYSPLHVAAHFGSVAMVKQLLDAEVNVVDGQNELGYTPLHQAAQQGHSQIVNLLLETGKASPNTVSNVSWISIIFFPITFFLYIEFS